MYIEVNMKELDLLYFPNSSNNPCVCNLVWSTFKKK